MSSVIEIKSIDDFIKFKKNKRGIIYYGASWCEGCKQIDNLYARIADRYKDLIKLAHVDVDVIKFDITQVPVLTSYYNGTIISSTIGADNNKLKEFVKEAIEYGKIPKSQAPTSPEISIPKQIKRGPILTRLPDNYHNKPKAFEEIGKSKSKNETKGKRIYLEDI